MVKNLENDIPIINYGELNIPRCEKKECRAYFNPFVTFEDYGNIWIFLLFSLTLQRCSNAKVSKSVEPSLDEEALRVVITMPKWVPGKQYGEPVRVKYTVPVTFRL